jgi:twitching motility protein PilT
MEPFIATQLRIVKEATKGFFSDVHVREQDKMCIRTTLGLEAHDSPVVTRHEILEFLHWTNPGRNVESEMKANGGEVNFSLEFDGDTYRCNLSYFGGTQWYAMFLRKQDQEIRSLPELGLPDSLQRWLEPESGLVLIVGPTGSGKTSTLASMTEHLNRTRRIHILTLEDPIEFRFKPNLATITQREIGKDATTFASAARNALRQDPDVVMVGEIRDLGSAREALRLSETGHLVLASLHADSAVGAIDRIAKLVEGADEQRLLMHTLGTQLIGVLYQRLIVTKRASAVGLPLRAPLYEVLSNIPAVASLIRDGKVVEIPGAVAMAGANQNQISIDQVLERMLKIDLIDRKTAESARRARERTEGSMDRETV